MMSYTHIVVPTDFSPLANHAVRHAFEEAAHHQAAVTLMHVIHHHADTAVYYPQGSLDRNRAATEFGASVPVYQGHESEPIRRDFVDEALTQLRDLIPASFTGTWDVDVRHGHPADEIVRVAQEQGADLIVMGTHGRTGLAHVLLGSVAERVIRQAPCPVLVMRQGSQPNADG